MLLSTQQDAFYTLAAAGQKLRRELASVLQVWRSLLRLFQCGGCISRAYFRGLQRHHRVFCINRAGSRGGGPQIGRRRSREADGLAAGCRGEAPWRDPAAAVCVQVPDQGPICDACMDVPARRCRFPTGPASISKHCLKAL